MSDILTPAQEFETPEDALAHYGVKGMKWGKTTTKPTDGDVRDARARIASKQRRLNAQIDKTNLASPKQQAKEAKKLNEMSVDFLKDPDRATSLRMTRGEKYILAAIAVGVPGVGTTAAGISSGSRLAARKVVERQQRNMAS